MPTDPLRTAEMNRLIAARDEALRRCAQHTMAATLKTSQWSALAVRRSAAARGRPFSANVPAQPVHAR